MGPAYRLGSLNLNPTSHLSLNYHRAICCFPDQGDTLWCRIQRLRRLASSSSKWTEVSVRNPLTPTQVIHRVLAHLQFLLQQFPISLDKATALLSACTLWCIRNSPIAAETSNKTRGADYAMTRYQRREWVIPECVSD